ncbi:MAG TPA: UbiX family flavin prenyltransferase [Thermopetrobacter sp.]|nr:UbiX family flavin prenyltransferase [Thermopetrobacter sp.]
MNDGRDHDRSAAAERPARSSPPPHRVLVGISGASGAAYGLFALRRLAARADVETHLVVTDAARRTIAAELDVPLSRLRELADVVHDVRDIGAPPASGGFAMAGMIVAPCSVHTLSAIAVSQADNLLLRAADVTLKERRPLVLMLRETPLHLGHIRAMEAVTAMGAVVFPPVPAFYTRPRDIDDIIGQSVDRALSLLRLPPAPSAP